MIIIGPTETIIERCANTSCCVSLPGTELDVSKVKKEDAGQFMRGDYRTKVKKGTGLDQLFRFVVVDGLPRLIDGYDDKVAKIVDGGGDRVEEYMALVKSCEVAFVVVLLDLYLGRMIDCKKNGRPFIQPGEKQGKKHGVPNMEDKEEVYRKVVAKQIWKREDPKKKKIGADDLARRRCWFKAALDVWKQHDAEKKRAAAEAEEEAQDSNEGEEAGDGQQMGRRRKKPKQKPTASIIIPNDGYLQFSNVTAFGCV